MSQQAKDSRKAPAPRPESRLKPAEGSELESSALELDEADDGETGYDADAGPLESGFASRSVVLPSAADRSEFAEPGLSVDPEDLGRRFLEDAAQQELTGADPLSSDLDERDTDLEAGVAGLDLDEPGNFENEDLAAVDPEGSDEDPSEPSELDLTQDDLKEGSLFEQPSGDGTRSPNLKTDELEATLDRNERARRFGHKPPR